VKVLIVDDEKNIRESVARYLELEGIESVCAENGLAARRHLEEESFEAAVVDLRMPAMGGLELLAWLREQGPRIPVIMISAYGEVRDAVEAMKLGAEDYIVKPFDPEELIVRLRKIVENRLRSDQLELGRRTGEGAAVIVGESPAIVKIRKLVERIAPTTATVLITGESGTGKEVIARAVHALSAKANGPFTAVNLGAIPDTLLESELFGYEKGAFTGATVRKIGMFELATSGTLFLDEIGDLPLHLQVKLLRVLQERKIQRLGGLQAIPVDARVIAATNRHLEERVAEGQFREDLFYRLNVVRIEVPPLAEHREDIPYLVGHLIDRLGARAGRRISEVAPEAMEKLVAYDYPGNVRELENIVERAIIFADSGSIGPSDIDLPDRPAVRPPRPATLKSSERQAIVEALARWEGNRTKAAEALGISRRTLFNKIKEYGIEQ